MSICALSTPPTGQVASSASPASSATPEDEFSHLDDFVDLVVAHVEKVEQAELSQEATDDAGGKQLAAEKVSPQRTMPLPQTTYTNYKFLRDSLAAFFKERISTGKWSKYGTFPGKNRDKDLDEKLVELHLQKKRGYAARRWLIFKLSMGIYPPPVLDLDRDQVFDDYMKRLAPRMDDIMTEAIRSTQAWHCSDSIYLPYVRFSEESKAKELLVAEIEYFTEILAEALAGSTPTNVDSRVADFECKARQERRQLFLTNVKEAYGVEGHDESTISFNCFFCCLHLHLFQSWNVTLDTLAAAPLILEINPEQLDKLVDGSEETLYYISGYLLEKVRRYASKLKSVKNREAEAAFWKLFVNFNLAANRPGRLLPVAIVQEREGKPGALVSASSNWYDFVRLLEGIFLVNITPDQARARKGQIFHDIGREIRASALLRKAFLDCVPPELNQDEQRDLIRVYNDLLLPCFTKLKCRDVLRIISGSRPADAMNTLSLRKRVLYKKPESTSKKNCQNFK